MKKLLSFSVLILLMNLANAQDPLKVSLIMPFCSKQIAVNPNHSDAELGVMCREYYQGMQIALDSLGKKEAKIKLTVFDTQNDSTVMLKIMQKAAFKESQLIIGPVLQGGNKMLTKFCTDNKVYHVSPLMTFSKTKLSDNYWVSSNPDLPSFAEIILNDIQEKNDSANVIVVSDLSSLDKSLTPAFKKLAPSSKRIRIKTVSYTSTLDINTYLSATLPNIVIIPTTKEQVANSVLYHIKDTSGLICIGFQQWFDFKNADIQLWQHKHVQFVSTFFVDYTEEATRNFIRSYRERFFTEPTEAAFKGYDQGLLYIGSRYENGKSFMNDLDDEPVRMIHTTYKFKRNKEGGAFQNTYLNLIHFEGEVLKRIN